MDFRPLAQSPRDLGLRALKKFLWHPQTQMFRQMVVNAAGENHDLRPHPEWPLAVYRRLQAHAI